MAVRLYIVAIFAIGAASCLQVDVASGVLKCSNDPNRLCPAGYFCAVDNTCWKNGAPTNARSHKLGATCDSRDGCDSGFCVDGVCCESDCTANCQACDVNPGHCVTIQGKPHGYRACPYSDVPMCAATCDGSATDCTYPGPSVQCHPQTCMDGTPPYVESATYCNGIGFCGLPDGGMIYTSSCTAPDHGMAVCAGDHCDFTCYPPYVKQGASCVPGDMM